MKPEIEALLIGQRSQDEVEREDAVLKLGMLLEKNFLLRDTKDPGTRDTWQSVLDEPLLAIEMDQSDLSAVIAVFDEQLQKEDASLSIFHALSRTASPAAEAPLLRWLWKFGSEADEAAVRQALYSLEDVLLAALRERTLDEARSIFLHYNGVESLDRIAPRDRLGTIVNRIREKLGLSTPQPHPTDAGPGKK